MESPEPKQHVPVFVGSTFTDLQLYRDAVRDALVRLETLVKGMEYFGSRPGKPFDECLMVVRRCKVYIGLFGMRYGSIPDGHVQSLTHLEYEEAQRINLPSLIYLLDEDKQPVLPKFVETGEGARKLEMLKEHLKKDHTVSFFTTPEDLRAKILSDMPDLLRKLGVTLEVAGEPYNGHLLQQIKVLRKAAGSNIFRKLRLFGHRTNLLVRGMSKTAAVADFLRVLGFLGLAVSVMNPVFQVLSMPTSSLIMVFSVVAVYTHALLSALQRQPTRRLKYEQRKSFFALAISYAAIGVEIEPSLTLIRNIEVNVLRAIKSFIEDSVFDTQGTCFNVNLLVVHPSDPAVLVCIQRVNPGKPVPTFYNVAAVPEALEALRTLEPVYKPVFSNRLKEYQMIWHVPITLPHGEEQKCLALLSVDSLLRRHLDFADDRKSLLKGLSPYVALLRYSLSLRFTHNIWGDLN